MSNIFQRIFQKKVETKSVSCFDVFDLPGLGSRLPNNISAFQALEFYGSVAPVNLAVNKIVDQYETIPPVVENRNAKVIDHPVLELLKNPNANITQNEFMREVSIHYVVTGNAYIVATGNVNNAPLELFVVNPAEVVVDPSTLDPFPVAITVHLGTETIRFTRSSEITSFTSKRVRFISNNNRELWHIKNFNPLPFRLKGMSPLQPIFLEIQQYINASIHNNSLLMRGATLSGVFSLQDTETQLDQAQQDQLRAQISKFYSGAENAGKAFLTSKIDFKPMTQSNRDMDFGELKESVFQMIVNVLKIPLPLVVSDNMAFNNVDNATLALYDNAVLPLAHRLFNELSLFLLPRYPGSDKLKITFVLSELPALEPRRNAELVKEQSLNVLTIDEVRQMLGREPLMSGGDQLYIPANLVPVGEDNFPQDQPSKPVEAITKGLTGIQDHNGNEFFDEGNGALNDKSLTKDEEPGE